METLSPGSKAALAVRIWYWYLRIRLRLARGDLAGVMDWLGRTQGMPDGGISSRRLGRMIDRVLPPRPTGARCLHRSLVLLALLQRDRGAAELVIGLPREAASHEAHAWIEVDGVDVGPSPGGAGYVALARYRAGHPPSPAAVPPSGSATGSSVMRSRSAN